MKPLPKLIKAREVVTKPANFNIKDTVLETERLLDAKRQEIEDYRKSAIAQVKQEYQKSTQAAHSEGFQAGYQEGLAQARAEVDAKYRSELAREVAQRVASLGPVVERLADELDRSRERWMGEWERMGLELACAIARRVVRTAVAGPGETAQRALREALALVGRCPKVKVTLHPRDADSLRMVPGLWNTMRRAIDEIDIVPDPSMTAGGCQVESEFGVIDARIETQLARIEQELLGGLGPTKLLASQEPPPREKTQAEPAIPNIQVEPSAGEPQPAEPLAGGFSPLQDE